MAWQGHINRFQDAIRENVDLEAITDLATSIVYDLRQEEGLSSWEAYVVLGLLAMTMDDPAKTETIAGVGPEHWGAHVHRMGSRRPA